MKYVYPAIFTPVGNDEFDVKIPDLPGCRTCGNGLADAIFMAEDAMSMWLWDAESKSETIPAPTPAPIVNLPQFTNYIVADTDEYRKKYAAHSIKVSPMPSYHH